MLAQSVVKFLKIILKSGGNNPLEQCAQHTLLYNMSYRLDATAKHDRWIGFREWYRHGWRKGTSQTPLSTVQPVVQNSNPAHLLITWNHLRDPKALSYVQQQDGNSVTHFLGKDEIQLLHLQASFFDRFIWHCCCLFIAFRCFLFSGQRPNFALVIRESIEMAFILGFCQSENIKKVTFFHPYEIDSNLLSLHLIQQKIKVQFVPSIIPLYVHNHHLVCDELVITTPYQLEEIKNQFSTSIFYKSIKYWSAESLDATIPKNPQWASVSENPKTLAFYSHGQWLRNLLNRADNGLNIKATEENLLQIVNDLVNHYGLELTVFLHPLEKKNLEKATTYYNDKLKVPFRFGNLEERSAQSFQQFHWGMGALSSVIFERLLMGHKTILFQTPGFIFPMASSGLKNIALHSSKEIVDCIERHQEDSAQTFFEKNNLSNYFHFPELR